jgi:hypothetical protein
MKKDYILDIYRSTKTVFTVNDISIIWEVTNLSFVKLKIHRLLISGKLLRIRKGFYAKDENYSREEFANRLYSPSYVSLETVLVKEGLIFQYYENVTMISYLSREIEVQKQKYSYRRIKYDILLNQSGILLKDGYFAASKERAMLDILYLNKDYYFDNLLEVDWIKLKEISKIYKSSRINKIIKKLEKDEII